MSSVSQYFKGLFGGIGALLTGMGVTLKELFTKKITQQYPENRDTLVMSDRFRGELIMPHDDNNEHACTSCGICEMNCPNGTIQIKSRMIETEDGKKKKILDTYHYNLGMCTFCNLCVITCPSDAIKFDTVFENAIFTRARLNMKLNHEDSKLREKKKPAPKPADDKPIATPVVEKPVSDEVVEAKPVVEKAIVEKPIVEKSTETIEEKPQNIEKPTETPAPKPQVEEHPIEKIIEKTEEGIHPEEKPIVVETPVEESMEMPVVENQPIVETLDIENRQGNKPTLENKVLVEKIVEENPIEKIIEKPLEVIDAVSDPVIEKLISEKPIEILESKPKDVEIVEAVPASKARSAEKAIEEGSAEATKAIKIAEIRTPERRIAPIIKDTSISEKPKTGDKSDKKPTSEDNSTDNKTTGGDRDKKRYI